MQALKSLFLEGETIDYYEASEVTYNDLPDIKFIANSTKCKYANIESAFDIETTSFYDQGEKRACMYVWCFGVGNMIIVGRTWKEFHDLLDLIIFKYEITYSKRFVIYVHFLSYEFGFLLNQFEWKNVFAVKSHTPLFAITEQGVEFRCSYLLTQYKLEKVGEHLIKHNIKKLVGDLDYSLMRHSKTPISDKEMGYIINDVRILLAHINEQIEIEGGLITSIPRTNTGYVRRYIKKECLNYKKDYGKSYYRYNTLMRTMSLTKERYAQLKRAFAGGFTHCSSWHTDKVYKDVASFDFISSYPAVMVSEMFPMSGGRKVEEPPQSIEAFEKILNLYCCIFDIKLYGVAEKRLADHPISASRCWTSKGVVEDNGRVAFADEIGITITNVDYYIIKKFYHWESFEVSNLYIYDKGYLPTSFVKAVLELYKNKTEYKGKKGFEVEYMNSKGKLNSSFGMCCTDICKMVNTIRKTQDDSWTWGDDPDEDSEKKAKRIEDYINKKINKYNNDKARFLSYEWGVFIVSYARANLFSAIYDIGEDYIYADTDSVKILNYRKHSDYFEWYNNKIYNKLVRACKHHKIPIDYIMPENIKGEKKLLGIWEFEHNKPFTRFKSLGAKRYMTEMDGEISITVSGLNKEYASDYIGKYNTLGLYSDIIDIFPQMQEEIQNDLKYLKQYVTDPFELFAEGLYVPKEYTGKMTHTYIEDETTGYITDYQGNTAMYHEYSSVHLEESDYTLSRDSKYIEYLEGRRTMEDEIL